MVPKSFITFPFLSYIQLRVKNTIYILILIISHSITLLEPGWWPSFPQMLLWVHYNQELNNFVFNKDWMSIRCAVNKSGSLLILDQQGTIIKPSVKAWQHKCHTGATEMEFDWYQCLYHYILKGENSFVEFNSLYIQYPSFTFCL